MKIGYRARIGLMIVPIVLMGLAFYFLWYKPISLERQANEARRDALRVERDQLVAEIERGKALIPTIGEVVKEGQVIAERFFPYDEMETNLMDWYIQEIMDATELWVGGDFKVSTRVVTTLAYDLNPHTTLIYPLFNLADTTGDIEESIKEKMHYEDSLAKRGRENVIAVQLGTGYYAERESVLNFLDSVERKFAEIKANDGKTGTAKVSELEIDNWWFRGEDDAIIRDDDTLEPEDWYQGYSEGHVVMTFYFIEPIRTPDLDEYTKGLSN